MAPRRPAVSAPAKVKMRKNHGPKRKMFHSLGCKGVRNTVEKTGVLAKEYDFESFALALIDRGIKTFHKDLWEQWVVIFGKTNPRELRAASKAFFASAAELHKQVIQKSSSKR